MNKLKIFEDKQIRSHWDAEKELWFFSVVDIISILTSSDRPRKYWSDLKLKLNQEGSELSEKIGQLKMRIFNFIMKEAKPCHVTREGHIIPYGIVMQAGHMQLYGVTTLVFRVNCIIISVDFYLKNIFSRLLKNY